MPQPIRSHPLLTDRETEVMHWLACGKTDADIAALLAISVRTVQKHLEHIYVKLGVENRTAAVMRLAINCVASRLVPSGARTLMSNPDWSSCGVKFTLTTRKIGTLEKSTSTASVAMTQRWAIDHSNMRV